VLNPLDLYHNAVRAKEIATVLARYGFSDLLQHLDRQPGLLQRIAPKPKEALTTWERLRLACEDLGPTFVKFGQILSTRPDIIPQPLVLELRKLQDEVRPHPLAEIRAVAEEELRGGLEGVFEDLAETPVASASLAQVYFARLRATGEEVAVKIQRPHVRKTVEADLDILGWFARQLHQRVEGLKPFDLPSILKELESAIFKELDFRNEGRNMRFFNAENPFPETVFAPRVHEGLTTLRMLVMERVVGRRIDELSTTAEERKRLARNGALSLLHQVLISGFFHADPHAGNLAVTPDGRLCFYDWGMVGQLTRRMRYHLADLFVAAVEHDAERIVRIALLLSYSSRKIDLKKMEKEVTITLREHLDLDTGHPEVGQLVLRLFYIFGSNGIDVMQDYSLMAKAVLSIEETAEQLDPAFDIRKTAMPMIRQLERERRSPAVALKDARMAIHAVYQLLKELPAEGARLLRRLENDDLTLNFQHKGLEDLTDSFNSASSRITLGVIIGSLLIGSSLIITTGIRPHLFGFPAIGMIGYLLSAVLSFWIVIDIIRHGRHR
jgi:ubiquinone biosynthesis protein